MIAGADVTVELRQENAREANRNRYEPIAPVILRVANDGAKMSPACPPTFTRYRSCVAELRNIQATNATAAATRTVTLLIVPTTWESGSEGRFYLDVYTSVPSRLRAVG